jgi:uncharacterized coiled-coil DUF342 family protein
MLVELQSNQFKFESEIVNKIDGIKIENNGLRSKNAKLQEDVKTLKEQITSKENAIKAYQKQIEILSNDIDDTTDLTTIIKMLNRHKVPLSVINKVVNHITNESVTNQTA